MEKLITQRQLLEQTGVTELGYMREITPVQTSGTHAWLSLAPVILLHIHIAFNNATSGVL